LLRFPLTAGENSKTVFVKINRVLGTNAAFYSGDVNVEFPAQLTLLHRNSLQDHHSYPPQNNHKNNADKN
jgi:hypothetical protein